VCYSRLTHGIRLRAKIRLDRFTLSPSGGENPNFCRFYSARNARIASAVLATAIPSVCLSVRPSHAGIVSKRRHVARCSLHRWIAKETKNIPQGRPLPPEILAQSDLPIPEGCEFRHVVPCSASTVRDRKRSSTPLNKNSARAFQRVIHQGSTPPLSSSKWGSKCLELSYFGRLRQ